MARQPHNFQLPASREPLPIRKGEVVPGARVAIISQATDISREQKTGEDGHYLFTNLTPGSYTVRVESAGFAVKEFKVTIATVFLNQVLNFSRSRS